MSGLALLRGLSGLALPALALITWRSRDTSPLPSHEGESDQARAPLTRPTRKEMLAMIAGDRDMTELDLSRTNLKGVNLSGRRLTGSNLSRARLAGARLSKADLSGATLDFADLSHCDLKGANLSGSSLLETSFWGSDLSGADLAGSKNIVMANLRRARYDRHTRWPGRLDPTSLGAHRTDLKSK